MIEQQLVGRRISDPRVLAAMRRVPREEFLPADERHHAYEDAPQPIGFGQTISQPYMVARMAELLELSPSDRVLDIGTGCGYAAAVLSLLCSQVCSVEYIPQLAQAARARLARLGFGNISLHCADGTLGWPDEAPFDAINVAAAPLTTPPALLEQLSEGGRLLIPIGRVGGAQSLMLHRRGPQGISSHNVGSVVFVAMHGRQAG